MGRDGGGAAARGRGQGLVGSCRLAAGVWRARLLLLDCWPRVRAVTPRHQLQLQLGLGPACSGVRGFAGRWPLWVVRACSVAAVMRACARACVLGGGLRRRESDMGHLLLGWSAGG